MKLADVSIDSIFGKINPPPGPTSLNQADPVVGLSRLVVVALQLVLFIGGIVLLIYLMWGAYDWITSAGDKEKLSRAQLKITHAIIGLFILVLSLSIFMILTGNILGIIIRTDGGFKIKIPTLEEKTIPGSGPAHPAIPF